MPARETLAALLTAPTPEVLWRLRAELLEAGVAAGAPVWSAIDAFHAFLDALATGSASRRHSDLASRLDIGAVGGVVLEDLLESENGGELALRLLSAVLSEGLMVLATRQHVRAWEGELEAVQRSAAWYLYGEMWRWSAAHRPELSPAARRELLDRLFAPALDASTEPAVRVVLLGHLFQLLVASHARDASAA